MTARSHATLNFCKVQIRIQPGNRVSDTQNIYTACARSKLHTTNAQAQLASTYIVVNRYSKYSMNFRRDHKTNVSLFVSYIRRRTKYQIAGLRFESDEIQLKNLDDKLKLNGCHRQPTTVVMVNEYICGNETRDVH